MKKYLKIVIFIIFLISIHIISFADYESEKENYNYYGNDWDNFYTYIQDKLNNDKNGNGYIDSNSISDKDIDRYLAGPTKEDKANGIPLFGDADTISMYSEILRNYKSARADKKESNPSTGSGSATGTGTSGSIMDDTKWRQDKAKAYEFYEKAMKEKDSNKGKAYCQSFKSKVNDMLANNKTRTLNDSDIMAWNNDIDAKLKSYGETGKNIYENQVDDKGNVVTPGEEDDYIMYQNPELSDTTTTAPGTIEGVMSDADKFMNEVSGEINPIGKGTKSLQDFSKVVSGILLTIGIALSVIMGGILGIKFMTGSVGEKADVKELLTPYVIGCIVVFGAYAIWNLAVTLFGNL